MDNILSQLKGIFDLFLSFISVIPPIAECLKKYYLNNLYKENPGLQVVRITTLDDFTKYYISPDCSSVDPCYESEERNIVITQEPLFKKMDAFLSQKTRSDKRSQHLFLLADSGMGKTAFMLNYWLYNRSRVKQRHNIFIVPLGRDGADENIKEFIQNQNNDPKNTVLFLDSFDEDKLAIANHKERISALMKLCRDFKLVVITCRTQFFSRDEEIPKRTGIIRIHPTSLGDSKEHEFVKLYIVPFDEKQVTMYLKRRYPKRLFFFRPADFAKARDIIEKRIPSLSMRPMILSYIPDFIEGVWPAAQTYNSARLYGIIIDKWLERESPYSDAKQLYDFSLIVAEKLSLDRSISKGEGIPGDQLEPLAKMKGINLPGVVLRSRSLLNRDAEGKYKFAHRSIMEYLFILLFIANPDKYADIVWTSQMGRFLIEMMHNKSADGIVDLNRMVAPRINLSRLDLRGVQLRNADLTGADLSEADLTKAHLENAKLTGADLSGAVLQGAYLSDAECIRTNLLEANLDYADLRGADFSHAIFGATSLRMADLRNTKITDRRIIEGTVG